VAGERDDRLQTNVARFIVVVAIFGAVVSWQASERSQEASTYDQQAAQDRIVAEQARAQSRSSVAQDLRLLGPAQEAFRAQVLLRQDARKAERAGDFQLAEALRVEARRKRLEGNTVGRFVVGWFFEIERNGALSYNSRRAVQFNDANNADLEGLRPDETRRLGDEAHDKSVKLVAAATTLVTALFFLTLSQLGGSLRRGFAGVGVAVALLGAVLFVLA
jgi:hypothetical protein